MTFDGLNRFLLLCARKGFLKPLRESCYRKFCRQNKGRSFLVTTKFGTSMKVIIGDSVDNQIYVKNVFEFATSNLMQKLSRKSNCLVDVGCNIGYFSCLFGKSNPQAFIYSIDPNPKMYERTIENLKLNQIRKFETFNCGISSRNDTLKFYIPRRRHSLASFLQPEKDLDDTDIMEIEVRPLMNVLDGKNLNNAVLKIDTEGFEYNVLSGISPADAQNFSYIIFEFASDHLRQAGLTGKEIFDIPWFKNYEAFSIKSDGSLEPFVYRDETDYNLNICMKRKGFSID